MLAEGADLPDDDVTVQDAKQDAYLTQQQVPLPLGHLGYGDLQDQLHQVPLPRV